MSNTHTYVRVCVCYYKETIDFIVFFLRNNNLIVFNSFNDSRTTLDCISDMCALITLLATITTLTNFFLHIFTTHEHLFLRFNPIFEYIFIKKPPKLFCCTLQIIISRVCPDKWCH